MFFEQSAPFRMHAAVDERHDGFVCAQWIFVCGEFDLFLSLGLLFLAEGSSFFGFEFLFCGFEGRFGGGGARHCSRSGSVLLVCVVSYFRI